MLTSFNGGELLAVINSLYDTAAHVWFVSRLSVLFHKSALYMYTSWVEQNFQDLSPHL